MPIEFESITSFFVNSSFGGHDLDGHFCAIIINEINDSKWLFTFHYISKGSKCMWRHNLEECVHELGCYDASTALMTSDCAICSNICLYPVILYIFYLI